MLDRDGISNTLEGFLVFVGEDNHFAGSKKAAKPTWIKK